MESEQRYTQFDIDTLRPDKRQRVEATVTSGSPGTQETSKKKRFQGPLKALTLPSTPSPERLSGKLRTRHDSPWETFKGIYKCDLAGEFYLVTSKSPPHRTAAMRQAKGEKVQRTLKVLRTTSHDNLLSADSCFLFNNSLFYIHEDMPITLDNIVSCNIALCDKELSLILSQARGR